MGTGSLGGDAATTATGADNVMIGGQTARAATSAACNVLIGSRAGTVSYTHLTLPTKA